MPLFKLGKNPPINDIRTLRFSYYTAQLAQAPAQSDYCSKISSWPMMRNDELGDCTVATAGHMIQQWTCYAGAGFTPSDEQIVKAYSRITGYKPGHPETDNGAYVLNVLKYWRVLGIADHRIKAFVSVNPKSHEEIRLSISLFGNCYLGVALPACVQQPPIGANGHPLWDVPVGGPVGNGLPWSWGGHAIPIVAYDEKHVVAVSWGKLYDITWAFLDTYCDEAWACLSRDWFNRQGIAPSGFNLTKLQSDLSVLDQMSV